MMQPAIPPSADQPQQPDTLQPDVLADLGGEPLAVSGFETDEPDPDFDERS